jgi:hypothetical protein
MFVLLFPSDILRHFPSDMHTPYLYNTLCDRKQITKIKQHARYISLYWYILQEK